MPPLVSVVLPVYNAEATLGRALKSLRTQTLADLEIIVVDDGSTDDSAALAAAQAVTDPRMRVFRQIHAGVVTAANRGLAEAQGRFIARMDADDVAHPERLAEQVALLEADAELAFASCQVNYGGDTDATAGFSRHVAWTNTILSPEDHRRVQFLEYPLANPTLCGRAEAWARVGPYEDGPFPEDYAWFLRAQAAGCRFRKVPRALLTWSDLPTRLTRTDARYRVEAFFAAKIPFLASWLQRNMSAQRPLALWGAGRITRKRLRPLLAHELPFAGWIDIDPAKIGQTGDDLPIEAPDALLRAGEKPFVLVAVGNLGARQQIQAWLAEHDFVEVRDYLLLA